MKKEKTKNKNTKPESFGMVKKVFSSRGFYITLASLVMIIGASFYSRYMQEKFVPEVATFDDNAWQEALESSGLEIIEVENNDPSYTDEANKKSAGVQQTTKALTSKEISVEVSAAAVEEDKQFSMERPCDGEIIADCSLDELVYCSTMEDWRTHNGIDFAAETGDSVRATEKGKISRVYEDELLGIVIELDHGNGIISRYGNLQSLDFIAAGVSVEKGDIVGGVGKTGALETDKGSHLHFEVLENGEYKNPKEYLNN